jgi:putative ABC transport system substrate-binding protein
MPTAWPTRREIGAQLGILALLGPVASRAQPALPVIGYLGAQTPASFASRIAAFREGLAETGFVEGRNVLVEFRWAEGQHNRLPDLARDLVARQVAVIVAPGGAPAALAAKSVTTKVPIVFEMGADPVALGLVGDLNRPDGNLTGISSLNVEVTPKRLEMIHELTPAAAKIAILVNPTSPTTESQLRSLEKPAQAFGSKLHLFRASIEPDFEGVFEAIAQLRPDGLVVASDTFFATHAERMAALAARHRLPAIHQSRDFAFAGGLMSYGGSFVESHKRAGVYTGRILKGEKLASLPVQQVTKLELVLNKSTAKTIGLSFPLSLTIRADLIID